MTAKATLTLPDLADLPAIDAWTQVTQERIATGPHTSIPGLTRGTLHAQFDAEAARRVFDWMLDHDSTPVAFTLRTERGVFSGILLVSSEADPDGRITWPINHLDE
jgi:hypothetical protein